MALLTTPVLVGPEVTLRPLALDDVGEWPPGSDLHRFDRPDTVEIGSTWLAASAQRQRCNTEAKLLMLTHAFEHWRVHSVSFKTDERNVRSRRAIERLGARFDGVRRADMPGVDGTVRSSARLRQMLSMA